MRGRKPSGREYVDRLPGSEQAKERVKAILGTLDGSERVQEACARLGFSEPRFQQLRERALRAAVRELESRPAGRPPRAGVDPEVQALRERVAALEVELRAAGVRTELAVVLPRATAASAAAGPEKKTRRRRRTRGCVPRSPPPTPRSDT